jgi:murein DD-endopeptidase MepM/ murein hydrolase activator NlpD
MEFLRLYSTKNPQPTEQHGILRKKMYVEVAFMFKKIRELFALDTSIAEKKWQLSELSTQVAELDRLKEETITEVKRNFEAEGRGIVALAEEKAKQLAEKSESELAALLTTIERLQSESQAAQEAADKLAKELAKNERLAKKHKIEAAGIQKFIEAFPSAINFSIIEEELRQQFESAMDEEGVLDTIVHLNLHHKDSKALRSDMNKNNKDIKTLLANYQSRYTTKANATIYELMVIGLQAELQNILYTLSYSNLDAALENSKALIHKYLTISGNGNASILPTITRFLSELEPLFENAVRIEYQYYVQKEKEKEEQRRIREIMKQEAEEKRLLEEERMKIEKEEEKYLAELAKNRELLLAETDEAKKQALEARIQEIEGQYQQLEEQKEEIIKRANGKAGYVYVISNLGSFGEEMFKVGMTRRLDPMERIAELGDASVPFTFDVHAMVFSNDAVALEQQLHQTLDRERVNKINLRKEFFRTSVERLQEIVQDIDPTAEFTTTMAALEYRQSESLRKEEQKEYAIA